jgi:hypothetical protein
MPMLLLDAIKATTQASEKQAAELKQLAARVATLTPMPAVAVAVAEPNTTTPDRPPGQRRARCCLRRRISRDRHTLSERPTVRTGDHARSGTTINNSRHNSLPVGDADGFIDPATAEPTASFAATVARSDISVESAGVPGYRQEIDGPAGRARTSGATMPGLE